MTRPRAQSCELIDGESPQRNGAGPMPRAVSRAPGVRDLCAFEGPRRRKGQRCRPYERSCAGTGCFACRVLCVAREIVFDPCVFDVFLGRTFGFEGQAHRFAAGTAGRTGDCPDDPIACELCSREADAGCCGGCWCHQNGRFAGISCNQVEGRAGCDDSAAVTYRVAAAFDSEKFSRTAGAAYSDFPCCRATGVETSAEGKRGAADLGLIGCREEAGRGGGDKGGGPAEMDFLSRGGRGYGEHCRHPEGEQHRLLTHKCAFPYRYRGLAAPVLE
jgi:hypothetical protein